MKYLCSVSMAEVSRREMVSVRQDCVKRAVSSAYNASQLSIGGMWHVGNVDGKECINIA